MNAKSKADSRISIWILSIHSYLGFWILDFGFARRARRGFTLTEVIVSLGVFVLIALGIYGVMTYTTKLASASKARIAASTLANEQIEIIRNMPYASVGTVAGVPSGTIPPTQVITRAGVTFTVATTVRNIDEPFDGTAGGTPNDTAPADSKLVEISVSCTTCTGNPPLIFTTTVAPRNLEAASTNGSLFVRVFDASGVAISQANVHVENSAVNPALSIDDVTNNSGILQLIDVPTSTESYSILVTKSGYSTEQTHTTGAIGNPNPTKPHASVAVQQVTQLSFAIDRVSTLDISTVNQTCGSAANVAFQVDGSKLIGTDPEVKKYTQGLTSDGNGKRTLTNMEWDTYSIILTDANYDLAGSIPLTPLALAPNAVMPLTLVLAPHTSHSLLVTTLDSATLLPLSGAQVRLLGGIYDQTYETNRGYLRQTDWSGGGSQEEYVDTLRYIDNNGGLDATTTPGDIKLKQTAGSYAASGMITSSTFDLGPGTNYVTVAWRPTDQPVQTGTNNVLLQLASNNSSPTTVWNFTGPDGTSATYYHPGSNSVHSSHNNNRYIRYQITMATADPAFTPNVSDIELTFVNGCVPPGQVFFSSLASGSYTLETGMNGYATTTDTIPVTGRSAQTVILSP